MRFYNDYDSCYNQIDQGPYPFVTDLCQDTIQNNNFRTTRWTGMDLQLTLMTIPCNSEIGLEIHPDTDQFFYIESGNGIMMMGECKNNLDYQCKVIPGAGIFVPANTWHNLVNTGCCPIKLFSVYAPPHHPHGTIHVTKADSDREENYH